MSTTGQVPRFKPGQRILATRSGHSAHADSLAEVLQVLAGDVYRVRWQQGHETFFLPGPDARDRRQRDFGPPRGVPERRLG